MKTTPTRVLLYSISALLIGYAAYGVSTINNSPDRTEGLKNYYGAKAGEGYFFEINSETGRLALVSESDSVSGRSCKKNYVASAGLRTVAVAAPLDDEDCECQCDEVQEPGSCEWDVVRKCEFIPSGTCQGTCIWHLEDENGDPCTPKSEIEYRCEDDENGECACADIYDSPITPPPGCSFVVPKGLLPTGDDVLCDDTAEDGCDHCRRQDSTGRFTRWRCDYNPPNP